MKPRLPFPELVKQMMARTGKSYHACCAQLGSNGGRAAAAKKRKLSAEKRKQQSMHIE